MPQQTDKPTQREEIRIDRVNRSSHPPSPQGLNPMQRWQIETDGQQPWNALAAVIRDAGWQESVAERGTSSTEGQNGSVGTIAK